MLKVLLVAHIGFPWGGPTQRYFDLIESSLARKVELTFFESSPHRKSFKNAGRLNFLNAAEFLAVFTKYLVTLLKVRPSIVHIATTFGYSFIKHSMMLVAARWLGSKVILAPHCSILKFLPASPILIRWMRFVLDQCNGLIVLSREWASIKDIAPRPEIIYLKNSINLRSYLDLPRLLKKPGEDVQIIYLGHVGKDKGTLDLIQAVNILVQKGIHGYQVFIYGEDLHPGETDEAEALSKSLSLQEIIHFNHPVFGDMKLKAFQDADIFVFPSHHEGMPISIIEALASGLPVIATNVGGIPDMIADSKNGILIDPMTPPRIASALINLIDNEQLRHNLGLEGRAKVASNHEIENYVDHLVDYYQRIAAG